MCMLPRRPVSSLQFGTALALLSAEVLFAVRGCTGASGRQGEPSFWCYSRGSQLALILLVFQLCICLAQQPCCTIEAMNTAR